ncbi:hypothetical protein X759_33005 [Mesorhizobium sp. LSHC420B00]|nr:hypothetical protein X759_33005 [Mesorhizobium sp. LSHC420B00]
MGATFYLPDELPKGAPLVVMLHGCTQTAAAYNRHSGWSRLSDETGFALLFHEQQRGNNPSLCFKWFQPDDAKRGSGEALSIRQMIKTMVVTHGLDHGLFGWRRNGSGHAGDISGSIWKAVRYCRPALRQRNDNPGRVR